MQETHSTLETAQKSEKQWKGKSLWHSSPVKKASGVAILFKENLNLEIVKFGQRSKWSNSKMFYTT